MKAKYYLTLLVLLIGFFVNTVSAAVTLVNFNAQTVDRKVILEWETTSETYMQYFVVLRSDQEDGVYNQVGGFIFTQGSSTSGLIYQYIDSDVLLNRTYFYKLEAVDYDYRIQTFGPVSITVLLATYTKTTTPSRTSTVTGTITPNTQTMTRTVTPSPTQIITATQTTTGTPTSPFSFITNTRTPTSTLTSHLSPSLTITQETETPEFTRTYEIISMHTSSPISSITATPVEENTTIPFRSAAIGFGISILIGSIVVLIFFILQRNRRQD